MDYIENNGIKSFMGVNESNNRSLISGTCELEVSVDDFDKTRQILEELGYHHQNYQESVIRTYELNGVVIEIDSWTLIPDYVEIKGSSESDVLNTLNLLGISKDNITTLDVETIYKDIYGIDISILHELRFDEALLESN